MRVALGIVLALAALYALHRLALLAESRGWIYYRNRKASPGTAGNALLEIQSMLDPGRTHVLEAAREKEDSAEPSGDPPDSGEGRSSVNSPGGKKAP